MSKLTESMRDMLNLLEGDCGCDDDPCECEDLNACTVTDDEELDETSDDELDEEKDEDLDESHTAQWRRDIDALYNILGESDINQNHRVRPWIRVGDRVGFKDDIEQYGENKGKLTELFDRPVPWKVDYKDDRKAHYSFKVGKIHYRAIFFEQDNPGRWDFDFGTIRARKNTVKHDKDYRIDPQDFTPLAKRQGIEADTQESPTKVYATLIEIVKAFVAEYKPNLIEFRVLKYMDYKLYDKKMIPLLAKKLGFTYDRRDIEGDVVYRIHLS